VLGQHNERDYGKARQRANHKRKSKEYLIFALG
jgi:hypothetical protein